MSESERSVWTLAGLAGCASPESTDSPGAEFLRSVETDYLERRKYGEVDDDVASEIANCASDVYTWARWREFVDLAGWQVDMDDLRGDETDMTNLAGIALYVIAETLVRALIEEDAEGTEDAEEGGDDGE